MSKRKAVPIFKLYSFISLTSVFGLNGLAAAFVHLFPGVFYITSRFVIKHEAIRGLLCGVACSTAMTVCVILCYIMLLLLWQSGGGRGDAHRI